MTDTQAVKQIVREKGLKYSYLAKELGITYYSLKMKIENKTEFTTSQVTKMCNLLDISSLTKRQELFFREKVD